MMDSAFSGPHSVAEATFSAAFSAIINLLVLVVTVLQSWGLWNMARALRVERAWLAWIPYVQIHTLLRVSGKTWKWLLIWLAVNLSLLFLLIGSIIVTAVLAKVFSGGAAVMAGFAVSAVLGVAFVAATIVPQARLVRSLSGRLGRGGWAAVGLFFFPAIFYPVFGHAAWKKAQLAA